MGLMDNLKEAVKDRVNAALTKKKYFPTSKDELKKLVDNELVKLGEIDVSAISDMSELFESSKRKDFSGIELWDVSNVTDMSAMFENAHLFNQRGIENWNVSKVENMSRMFYGCYFFDQPLGRWNVSSVTDMGYMFAECKSFDSDISAWDVSNVEDMSDMFHDAFTFNKPLNTWNVSKVTDMSSMFSGAYLFNQPLNSWDTSSVENMDSMFYDARNFNSEIDGWDLSSLNSARYMFAGCYFFNQPLNNWKLGNVENMDSMFSECYFFNQPLDSWNVSSVENFSHMFRNCYNFNQDISGWDMSSATDISHMLDNCVLFDQDLSAWNSDNITDSNGVFDGCYSLKEPKWLKEVEARIKANKASYDDYDEDDDDYDDYNDEDDESYDDESDDNSDKTISGCNFSCDGDDTIFEIPANALKFLCQEILKLDDALTYNFHTKELYPNGSVKTIKSTKAIYNFDENRQLVSLESNSIDVKLVVEQYFFKDEEKYVKGRIENWQKEDELLNNLDLSDNPNFDLKSLQSGDFSLVTTYNYRDFSVKYDEYGMLKFVGDDDLNIKFNENGIVKSVFIYDNDLEVEAEMYSKNNAEEDDDGYCTFVMPYAQFERALEEDLCDSVEEDDRGDFESAGDGMVKANRIFYKAYGYFRNGCSDDVEDGYDIEYEECDENDEEKHYCKMIEFKIERDSANYLAYAWIEMLDRSLGIHCWAEDHMPVLV